MRQLLKFSAEEREALVERKEPRQGQGELLEEKEDGRGKREQGHELQERKQPRAVLGEI